MFEIVVLIGIIGLTYLIYTIYIKEFNFSLNMGIIYYISMIGFFALILRGSSFAHYDDFSHWGLVARDLVIKDRFPNFESNLITFQSYPVGSASYIYFVAKIVGESEGVFLFAQSMLLISSITPLFAFVEKNKLLNVILIILSTLFFLVANNRPTVLLVDTLISLVGFGLLLLTIYYGKQGLIKKGIVYSLPIATFLMVIKNSAIFFVLMNFSVILYYLLKKYKLSRNTINWTLVSLIVPFSSSFLWSKHVEFAFSSGFEAKHSMSLDNYSTILAEKSSQDMRDIIELFMERNIDLSARDVRIVLFLIVLSIIFFIYSVIIEKGIWYRKIEWKLLWLGIVSYFIYQLSVLLMYLLSMPLGEALSLAGYGRYIFTFIIYWYAIVLLYIVTKNQTKEVQLRINRYVLSILLIVFVIVPFYLRNGIEEFSRIIIDQPVDQRRELLKDTIYEYDLPENGNYHLYIGENNQLNSSQILYYIAKYDLKSNRITIHNEETIVNQKIPEEGYLIILEDDNTVRDQLLEKETKTLSHYIFQMK
jgi:hypothetical protein